MHPPSAGRMSLEQYLTMPDPRPQERLVVKDFLCIREACLDIRRFTVIIGPQASGKSILAKLVYFFRSFLSRQLIQNVEQSASKRDLIRDGIIAFERIFPQYAWADGHFEIEYQFDNYLIRVKRGTSSSKSASPILECSDEITDLYSHFRILYRKKHKEIQDAEGVNDEVSSRSFDALWGIRRGLLDTSPVFRSPTFIPSGRSFFATLQRTVFSFLANNVPIDPLIKEFGSIYESAKPIYLTRPRIARRSHEFTAANSLIRQDIERILVGRYSKQEDQDWIVAGNRRVNLTNASSGQQEALPMLIVLAARLPQRADADVFYCLEEPEAHLFPASQRRLVSIFSNLAGRFGYQFLLTTHSPYILSAINNLIFASALVGDQEPSSDPEVSNILDGAWPIRLADVSAYTVDEGTARTIVDNETGVIGSSIIDSVSDDFEATLHKLTTLEMERRA